MDEMRSVTRLIEQIRKGDQGEMTAAAVAIWNRYFPELLKLATRHLSPQLRGAVTGEDVASDACNTFLRRQALGMFDLADRDELWALLIEITRNKARKAARRETAGIRDVRRRQPHPDRDDDGVNWLAEYQGHPDPTPDEAISSAEELDRLLGVLNPELRRLAVLKLEGHTNVEIAKKLACAVRTVERRVDRIRERWQDVGYGPAPPTDETAEETC